MRIPAIAIGVLCVVTVLTPDVTGQQKVRNQTSALINEALDKNVNLTVNDVLPAVLKGIEDKTGVRIVATDSVYELLPWGEQTNIKATVENQTLRAALTAIAQKLGLNWELGQFEVVLKPMPALTRLGRRATLTEIQALELVRTTNFVGGQPQMTARDLLHAVDQQLAKIKSPAVVLDIRSGDPGDAQSGFIELDKVINVPRESHLSVVLEDLVRQSNATWYPWGTKIVVVPKQQAERMQLDKSITAHFNGTEIGRVLEQLSLESGVPFQIEPGAYQRVPPQYRNIRLDLENATVRQVLEDIRGVTGLDFVVKGDGVYIWNQNPPAETGGAAGASDPVVALVPTESGMQVMLRASDVPADVRAYLAQVRHGAIVKLRQNMKAENFVPSTQSASTQPAVVK